MSEPIERRESMTPERLDKLILIGLLSEQSVHDSAKIIAFSCRTNGTEVTEFLITYRLFNRDEPTPHRPQRG